MNSCDKKLVIILVLLKAYIPAVRRLGMLYFLHKDRSRKSECHSPKTKSMLLGIRGGNLSLIKQAPNEKVTLLKMKRTVHKQGFFFFGWSTK